MNRYTFLLLITLVFAGTISCKKDFLDVPTKTTTTRQEYVKDLATTGGFLNGIYIILARDFYNGGNQVYPELVADNIKLVTGGTNMADQYNWNQTVMGSNMGTLWGTGYQLIRSCSFVIEKAEAYRSQDPVKADDLKAQAYSIRALVHFILVNVFAQPYGFTADASHPGIPYVTTYDWLQPVSRQTVAEVYTGIIADINAALPLFNTGTINVLLMNRNAAKALLARACLFKSDYQTAKNAAREVGTAVPVMTGSNYPSKLFTAQETEALFQLFPSSTQAAVGGTYATQFQGRYFTGQSFNIQFLATTDIANLLRQNPQDVRSNWIKPGSDPGKDTIVKYPVNVIPGFNPTTASYYQTLLRSSEMYLTAAEAYAKLNNEDSARFYLDAIRLRADPTALPSAATGAALLDSIYTERRKELAFEGLRMFDLLRWKKPVDRIDALSPAVQHLPFPSNKAVSPIPMLDVTVSGLSQNPGY